MKFTNNKLHNILYCEFPCTQPILTEPFDFCLTLLSIPIS